MRRGEVWWANLPPPVGRRPVVLVTRDGVYHARTSLTAVVTTTRVRDIPVEVPLGLEDGLPRECVVNADNIVTIRMSELRERIAQLSPAKTAELEQAIKFALALPG